MRRHRTHHKAAEQHLNDAVSLLVQAKESIGYAQERNASARAAHEAALAFHGQGLAVAASRELEAEHLLLTLTGVAED